MKIVTSDHSRRLEWATQDHQALDRAVDRLSHAQLLIGPDTPEGAIVGRAIRAMTAVKGQGYIELPLLEDIDDGLALDPDSIAGRDAVALLAVTQAEANIARAKDRLRDAVADARARGISWDRLGAVLGVSKQAVRERFLNLEKSDLAS